MIIFKSITSAKENSIMKYVCLLMLFVGSISTWAQLDIIETLQADSLTFDVEWNAYNHSYIYFRNTTNDTIHLNWRTVQQDNPEDWHMAVCDNYQCYGNIPNMADMAPIAPFDTVYMRVETNPFETPGEGVVRFRIYENGNTDEFTTFHFGLKAPQLSNTINTDKPINFSIFPNPTQDIVHLTNHSAASFKYRLLDNQGRQLFSGQIQQGEYRQIDVSHLPSSNYLLLFENDKTIFSHILTIN